MSSVWTAVVAVVVGLAALGVFLLVGAAWAALDDNSATTNSKPGGQKPAIARINEASAAPSPPEVAAVDTDEHQKAVLDEGKALFRGLCSGCHGGAGRGGKGPNLTDDRWLHGNKDEDIRQVIFKGVSGTTMKKLGESLKQEQIASIIAYIRFLGSVQVQDNWQPYMSGDPKRGEDLFFNEEGAAQCWKCHTINRRGGRIGPSLDRIAARRSPRYIMESILLPSQDIDPRYEQLMVETEDGDTITGLRVNENNFNIQMRDLEGQFYSLDKSDLVEVRVLKMSIMPENFAEFVTVKNLHDVFAYLMTLE